MGNEIDPEELERIRRELSDESLEQLRDVGRLKFDLYMATEALPDELKPYASYSLALQEEPGSMQQESVEEALDLHDIFEHYLDAFSRLDRFIGRGVASGTAAISNWGTGAQLMDGVQGLLYMVSGMAISHQDPEDPDHIDPEFMGRLGRDIERLGNVIAARMDQLEPDGKYAEGWARGWSAMWPDDEQDDE